MSSSDLEGLVAAFLAARENDPALAPEAFAAAHPDCEAALLRAIRNTLDVDELLPPDVSAACLPDVIGPYRVIEEIGRGGMGIVYRVERDGNRFALKLLPFAPVLGERVLERFRREVRLLTELSHPGIIRVHDSGMHDHAPYFVMDLVDGRPLDEMTNSLSIPETISLVERLCRTVHAAHEEGVLHRDLKPQNVILRSDGEPILLDFGLSAAADHPTLTRTGDLLGTPLYMAPEQLTGHVIDARTDVHALGLILYELATGRSARSEDGSREVVLSAVRVGRVPRPRRVNPRVSRALEKVILVALARRPDRRYPTALEMADDLARLRRGETVRAKPPGPIARTTEWARLHPWRAWAGVLGVALAALLVGFWLRTPTAPSHTAIAAAESSARHGVAHWLDDRPDSARAALRHALQMDEKNVTAAALLAHLDGGSLPRSATDATRRIVDALKLLEVQADSLAEVRLRSATEEGFRPPLVSALLGRLAGDGGRYEEAQRHLVAAADAMPTCVWVLRRLASVYGRLGEYEEAESLLLRADDLAPGSSQTWQDLAQLYLAQRDLENGIHAAERARELGDPEDTETLRTLAALRANNGEGAAARTILEELIRRDSTDVRSSFELAMAWDRDHRIVEAEAAYRRVITLDEGHGPALMCLANLYSGASSGECRGCDVAFARYPECLDRRKAEEHLLRCIEQDRAESSWVTNSILDIALRLPDRSRVIALLEHLTAGAERTPGTLHLEGVLRRLRLAEGDGSPE